MNIKQYVKNLDLAEGQKHRGKCPECGRHNTFTATNNLGKLLWNCYANSCRLSGIMTINMSVEEIKNKMEEHHKLKIQAGTTFNPHDLNIAKEKVAFKLPDHVVKSKDHEALLFKFGEDYGIDEESLGLLYDVKEDRIVFPMYDNNQLVDAIGRAVESSITPKWLRYGDYANGFIRGNCLIAVVVEDCISAAVVETLGLTGIAILGTSLTPSHIETLKNYRKVIVALDPDAAAKTIEYTKLLKGNGVNAFALKLLDDIKYRRKEDIQYLLKLKGEFLDGTPIINKPVK